MKTSLKVVYLSVLLCALATGSFNSVARANAQEESRGEAKRLWEKVIAAKGGRERLQGVRNMVVSTCGRYSNGRFKTYPVYFEDLLVFPNKYWSWNDYRPGLFGLRVSMYNYDTGMKYVITDVEPDYPMEHISDTERRQNYRKEDIKLAQLLYLLETEWFKPAIVNASTERAGRQRVDVIQTVVEGERWDFACDQKTHLPSKVTHFYVEPVTGKSFVKVERFSDYTEAGGIKVPQTITVGDGTEYKATFQFNVEYREDIFNQPPPVEAGPEVWKPSSSLTPQP
jgi:hypothetical protein